MNAKEFKEFVNSEEVKLQWIAPKERKQIFKSLGIEDMQEYEEKIMPLLRAYKKAIFEYGLSAIENELFIMHQYPNLKRQEITILDDVFITGSICEIYKKLGNVLKEEQKKVAAGLKELCKGKK